MLRNLNQSFVRGRVLGTPKTGVLGSAIPTVGEHGGSYLANDLTDLPADLSREICGRITMWPVSGELQAEETGAFTFTPSGDGAQSFQYQLSVFGVDVGSPATVALNSGGSGLTIIGVVGSANASGATASVSLNTLIGTELGVANAAQGLATITMSGAVTINCDVAMASASGFVAGVSNANYARSPAGSGYQAQRVTQKSRPPAIQKNRR